MKRLFKSREDRMVCGVCQGLSEYLGIDVTVIRLLWAIFALTGGGIPVYIAAAIIMPEKNEVKS